MPAYKIFPALDANYSFPPIVRRAVAASPEFAEEFANQVYPKVNAAVNDALATNSTVVASVNTAVNDVVAGRRIATYGSEGVSTPIVDHSDWAHVVTDTYGQIFAGVRKDGTHYFSRVESPTIVGTIVTSLSRLTDVAITTSIDNDVLAWVAGAWRSTDITTLLPPHKNTDGQVVYRDTALAASATLTRIATTTNVNPTITTGRIQGSIIAGGSGTISRIVDVDVYVAWNGAARAIVDKSVVVQTGDPAVTFSWVLLDATSELALDANYPTGVAIDVVASIRITGLVP